ncbi:MAG: ribosome biogenesis GTP-binding protein YihA/YsxC [Firmicutes bacterium]|nr:ribosome biogenesis GTP-binding protein YihA/YsxC [Bacillota bacterium]MCL2256352.1 ribosome biogenesis GTP-binding protein YihA/YsxC [Bacillota bacterium]
MNNYTIKKANFITSFANIKVYKDYRSEKTEKPMAEICVAGRSNVGKSSFINMLANNKKLAFSSSTPGRTRLINLFSFNDDEFLLADLPGYGYSKASKETTAEFQKLTEEYFYDNVFLKRAFVLVDIRHDPSDKDKQLLKFLHHLLIPFTVFATKSDKISKSQLVKHVQNLANHLQIGRDNIIPVSATTKLNLDKVLKVIENAIKQETVEEESGEDVKH